MIEEGRHHNVPIENRICPLCKSDIENEFTLLWNVLNYIIWENTYLKV